MKSIELKLSEKNNRTMEKFAFNFNHESVLFSKLIGVSFNGIVSYGQYEIDLKEDRGIYPHTRKRREENKAGYYDNS